jgi:hypothetical protein
MNASLLLYQHTSLGAKSCFALSYVCAFPEKGGKKGAKKDPEATGQDDLDFDISLVHSRL